MDLNKATIIGRLTRDPETKTIPSGQTVTTFSLATSFNWTDKSGQKQEKSEFHNIVTWGKLAEIAGQYLKKGGQIYIEGRLQTRSWDGDDGKKRYRTEIVGENMIMLGRPGTSENRPTNDSTPEPEAATPKKAPASDEEEINVEDIPF
ncbi:single-stranded DNA-binding protein [Patescibacteria group bacterium]|nr:single-stranded DNA-binding protein [Patescibacteria group bacterium]MBU1075416.1 single-stranded DNA-binding protein [Patescibacteria group bacterium]MBU1951650.1 single-stranded DNA-binding protein [Patescibacteria group bacterium]MBU2235958.1 single-stranded DNA-binding protein [Patescibacteria group bacterium]